MNSIRRRSEYAVYCEGGIFVRTYSSIDCQPEREGEAGVAVVECFNIDGRSDCR